MTAQNETAILKTMFQELIKEYATYDGSNRLSSLYQARANAENGDPCLRTQYEYSGATTRIVKRKESRAIWDSSWDI